MPVEEPRGWKRTLEEDLYFHKLDAELIDRLRRRRALETERRLLARASGTNDQAILKDLEGLGFNRDTVILLHLAPLVHVAWISGSVTDAQRERIFEIARLRGVTEGTPAHQRLSEWLGRRPSEEFFQTSLHAIRRVLQVLRPQERKIKKRNLIQYSIDIASASSSLFSLGRKVSAAERKLIRRIAAELEKENGAAARQVLEDARIAEEPPHQSLAFFQRILVVVEAEGAPAAALERAILLAKSHHAQVTLAGVYRPLAAGAADAAVAEAMRARLETLAGHARAEAVVAECRLLPGIPHIEIIREVIRGGFDLVMAGAAAPAPGEMLFDGTIMRLLRKCPCPVWAINGAHVGPYPGVLAAVDLDASGESADLNRKIIDLAVSMARSEGCALDVLHAWMLPGLDAAAMDQAAEQHEALLRRRMEELLPAQDLEGLAHRTHILRGDPAKVVLEAVHNRNIGLVVMGTVNRAAVPGLIIGDTAERILLRLDCSVLAVKPDGFVTPVLLEEA